MFGNSTELIYICKTLNPKKLEVNMFRKFKLLLIFCCISLFFNAQDLAISPSIVAPTSGCYLSSTSVVTIIIVNNLGSPYGGTFDISYTLNGGATVTESVTTVLPGSATYIYSFIATADLSACQVHNLDFVLTVPGDVNLTNNTLNVNVTSDCAPVPGWIVGPDTVCSGINSGNLVLTGYTGTVENWIQSTNGGSSWTWTGLTTPSIPYNNIATQELWWVLVGSLYGYCPDDSTAIDTIEVIPQTVAGTLPADFDICDNANGGQLDLTGYLGSILNWEMSQDGGATWSVIANTTDSLNYWNLMDTTLYQVQVQNGICPAVYSAPITLTLVPGSNAGSIVGELLVCNFDNDSSLEVNPIVGGVVDWLVSTDNGNTWITTGVSDTIYPYTGLLGYTIFAALIQTGSCSYDTAFHSIVVLPLGPSGGPDLTIFEGDTVQLQASGGSFFYWFPSTFMSDPNIYNPQVWPEVTTTYSVQVTDLNGCVDTANVLVTVLPNVTEVFIPNVLTPNGDGFNDYLSIPNIDTYPNNEIHIFNSYGQVIFEASPYNNDWAATFNGANVPDGTYYYILSLNDPVLAPDPYKGVITIIGND